MPLEDSVRELLDSKKRTQPAQVPSEPADSTNVADGGLVRSVSDLLQKKATSRATTLPIPEDWEPTWKVFPNPAKMILNALPNALEQWEDLGNIIKPETWKALGGLISESVASTREPRQQRVGRSVRGERRTQRRAGQRRRQLRDVDSPALDAVAQYYADRYDLTSKEGLRRFAYYMERYPLEFASDVVAIIGGGAGLAGKTLNANKWLKRAGRVAEFGVDPGSAIGRTAGGMLQWLSHKKTDLKITDTEWEKLKEYADDGSGAGGEAYVIHPKRPVKHYIRQGMNMLRNPDIARVVGGIVGYKIGDIEAAILGYISAPLVSKLLGDPVALEYVLKTPPQWLKNHPDILKSTGANVGRATQRVGRIDKSQEE